MWNRRDALVMVIAAFGTFGFTVGMFMPRRANAVDDTATATANVKVPTLNLENAQVTAILDPAKTHAILLTVRNTGEDQTTAHFTAAANVTGPSSPFSRIGPPSSVAWNQSYEISLHAGETKIISVDLPDAAFIQVAEQQQVQTAQAAVPAPAPFNTMIPGRSFLTLSGTAGNKPASILALALSSGAPVTAAKSTP